MVKNKTTVIVVEDNIVYCEFICNMLVREGFHTVQAYRLATARKLLQQASDGDIVLSDLRLPDGNGIDLLRWMRKEGLALPFIIMTDYAEVHTAVESMKLGSLDYIPKLLVEDRLVPLLRNILKEQDGRARRMPVFARDGSAFRAVMKRIKLVAPTDMSVLILGENGTGKEHIAHHLHEKSKRSGKPFVPVDCGSLSAQLAPSAFFGHVKGAFTGADNATQGYFHEADGGTLFLDEIGNLALETQQLLLRAIQERRYRPVGDKADRSFNVRIIAATNENLEKAVSEKRFRQDLLYRLHDFEITVPPLRDCQEDILPLAESSARQPIRNWSAAWKGSVPKPGKHCCHTRGRAMCANCGKRLWEQYCRHRKVSSERHIWNLAWRKHPLLPVSPCATMKRKRNGSCVP